MDTHFARRARQRPLDPLQHEFVLGSLLGDGTLLRTTAGWCFRVHHGLAQQWYVEHKYRFLEAYVQSPPRRSGKACYFRTVTHPEFSIYRERFYRSNQKIVPITLLRERLTGLSLAIWLMDDGCADGRGVRLNTQSFSYAENVALATLMRDVFDLEARVNRDKNGFRLRIAAGSRNRLIDLVEQHICPQMAYKLSL
jgi:recombination protein RecA